MSKTQPAAARVRSVGVCDPGAPALSDKQRSYKALFNSFTQDPQGRISPFEVLTRLRNAGIRADDRRIQDAWSALDTPGQDSGRLDLDRFIAICQRNSGIISRAIRGELVVPDFPRFVQDIESIYQELLNERAGAVANYIPQLGRIDPEQLAIAVCTTDGQRFSVGDHSVNFCLQSVCKPINYLLALEEHGASTVHRHVGCEPSGVHFNELSLSDRGIPHNPMINSGAIMCSSLIRPADMMADRFDYVADAWRRLAGGGRIGFNNAVYLSERDSADRNFALGYFMREKKAFPSGADLLNTLEFYFQCCSIEIDTESLAATAAALATGGIAPLTGTRLFSTDNVKKCLSLMSSCGMYDYSGEFAFRIGLPAKSGVSGALMIVVPQVMGIAVWSPRLDELGNSVRGIKFSQMLVEKYNLHVYDGLVSGDESGKRDPRRLKNQTTADGVVRLCWAASQGDLDDVRGAIATGIDPSTSDYDGRTALHLAASEGQLEVVRYLLQQGANPHARDRWGGTPATDADREGHTAVSRLLTRTPADDKPAAVS
jgi:glutaminase